MVTRESTGPETPLLRLQEVGKQYGKGLWGVRGVNISLGPGILGLVGPNGAGKSTLMRLLATVTRPTEGEVLWEGEDVARRPDRLRRVLGYLPQDFGVYPNLNAREFLAYVAALKGIEAKAAWRRIDELLGVLNLSAAAKRPLGGYSGGMRQRVGIAQALLNDPRLLIVDEPTVGLDPDERARFRYLLTDLAAEKLVILSTHIVSDVETTAERVAVMKGGRILVHATPEALISTVEGKVYAWTIPAHELPHIRERFLVSGTLRRSDGVRVRVVSETPPDSRAEAVRPTLEEAYLYAVEGSDEGQPMNGADEKEDRRCHARWVG
jgi:ABC-2 type transport system ATP-binding protein